MCGAVQVARAKSKNSSRWKVALRNGIMHLDGHDHVFHTCNGEMEF